MYYPPILRKYERFMVKNSSAIKGVEDTLRSLSYILPGRFEDSEYVSQALASTLNIIGMYHDAILTKAVIRAALSSGATPPTPSPFNRYTRFWLRSPLYYRIALILTVVQTLEVWIEIAVMKKYGEKGKWRAVTLIEIIKVACRLMLFRLSSYRMLLFQAFPEREVEPGELLPPDIDDEDPIPSLEREKETPAYNLVRPLYGVGRMADYIHILRPLIYVISLRKYGRESWRPWTASLLVELLSRGLSEWYLASRGKYLLERQENSRRWYLLLYYLLRPPFYQYTKEYLATFCQYGDKKPFLSVIAGIIGDYQPLWESFYFYTRAHRSLGMHGIFGAYDLYYIVTGVQSWKKYRSMRAYKGSQVNFIGTPPNRI
ncbi:uncharacterized protein VTP21DRAFT_9990 [Calcarisporiella thermophila]|uniref:uncharacterized protein n=1 Tax=Calcarisporiella thermophila TaxID=911321 RepID=UPI0037424CBA